MKCKNCGKKVKKSSNYCKYCGEKITKEKQVKKQSNKSILFGFLGAVSVLIIAAGTYFLYTVYRELEEDLISYRSKYSFINIDEEKGNSSFGEEEGVPIIKKISPTAGLVGTRVIISGENLTAYKIKSITLNNISLNIGSVKNQEVEVYIPYGSSSGKIEIRYDEGKISSDKFKVKSPQKELVLDTVITAKDKRQIAKSKHLSVTVPPNAVDSPKKLIIEETSEFEPVNLPQNTEGIVFSVTLEDVTKFEETLTIEYEIPKDETRMPSAAFFNEETSLWESIAHETKDGRLYIYTNHLTDFIIFYWGEAIYSKDGNFKIYFDKDDKTNYAGSMRDLAKKVGDTLEEVRKDYEAKIPKQYQETYTFMGFRDSMDVYLDSGLKDPAHNAITNNIKLVTNYSSKEDFEVTIAHELFHAYQDVVWNAAFGPMFRSYNKWAVEALAELAAHELAFPEKERKRELSKGAVPQNLYTAADDVHEYSMACFLSYMLDKYKSTIDALWIHIAGSGKANLGAAISEFFRTKSSKFISLDEEYGLFWRDVVGNSDYPKQEDLSSTFYKSAVLLNANKHSHEFSYRPQTGGTLSFKLFGVSQFRENMPIRVFNIECMESSKNGVWLAEVEGANRSNDLNSIRVSGGHSWEYLSLDSDKSYARCRFAEGKTESVILCLDGVLKNEISGVKITEIQAQCNPLRIDEAIAGKEYEFEFAFSDIFANAQSLIVKIDYGDGAFEEVVRQNVNGTLTEKFTHKFEKMMSTDVIGYLYDAANADRELICMIKIPVNVDKQIDINASPNPAEPEQTISFTTSFNDAAYTYKWDFGDGNTSSGKGLSQDSNAYEKEGEYGVTLKIYDENDEEIGSANKTITVKAPEIAALVYSWKWNGVPIQGENGTWNFVSILTFYNDGTCSFEFGTSDASRSTYVKTYGTYTFDNITNTGKVTFKNVNDSGYTTEVFSISGSNLDLGGEIYNRIQ